MSLGAAQRWMHQALVTPHRAGDVGEWLQQRLRLSPADGLAVYQRGYFLRIAHCMREQFPALCHALEQPLFDDFVADYIEQHPPQSHTLYDLGRRFPDFLEENRPDRDARLQDREGWIDFMIDLANFERSVFVLFDAPGHEGKPLATAETPDEALRLQPAFALGAYRYPVADYYHAVRQRQSAPLPGPADTRIALVRTNYVTRIVPLTQTHRIFLERMACGGGVEDGLAAVSAALSLPIDAVRAGWRAPTGPRRLWIDLGLFAR